VSWLARATGPALICLGFSACASPFVGRPRCPRALDGTFVQLSGVQTEYERASWARVLRTIRTHTGGEVVLQFTADAQGNVASVLKANGKQTDYTYQWGLMKDVLTAAHTTSRVINSEGTVASQTQGGRTTAFAYDDLYRLTNANGTWWQPPGKLNQYAYTMQYNDIHNILRKDQQHWIRNRGDSKPIPQHKTTYTWDYSYGSAKPHAARVKRERRARTWAVGGQG